MKVSSRSPRGRVLVVDDEPEVHLLLSRILADEGHEVRGAESGQEALKELDKGGYSLVLLDVRLPEMDGVQVLKEIKSRWPPLPVIMISGYEDVETAVEAMRSGALDYIIKPIPNEKICQMVTHVIRQYRLEVEMGNGRPTGPAFERLVGESQGLQKVRDLIQKVARYDVNVLIQGETGTGKELVARAIHDLSQRAKGPFVPVDCATIPETLVESELFGYERGAFTGAVNAKVGKWEAAHGGTIFLDEIGNLPLIMQSKLLRVLQERKFTRLGSVEERLMDVRLIAATNVDLSEAIEAGTFREDLTHRLSGVTIPLPPLRERGSDIEVLALYFLRQFNQRFHKQVSEVAPESGQLLASYPWPGNVRELEHAVEGAVILAEHAILPEHLPFKVQHRQDPYFSKEGERGSLKEASRKLVELKERELILSTLDEVGWNKTRAAQKLRIDYKTLFNKIKKYRIQSPVLRSERI